MPEIISRKYNWVYFIPIYIIYLAFISLPLLILILYAESITQVYVFIVVFIFLFLLIIRLNYILNHISINYDINQVVIEKKFSKKIFKIQEIDKIDTYIFTYINYLKINNKTYFFISRTYDFTNYFFLNHPNDDICRIRNDIRDFNNRFPPQSNS